jgi:hypothetical protein
MFETDGGYGWAWSVESAGFTDADGVFTVPGMGDGEYVLHIDALDGVHAPTYYPSAATPFDAKLITFREGATRQLRRDVKLRRAATMKGRITGKGQGVAGVDVLAFQLWLPPAGFDEDGELSPPEVVDTFGDTTDADGRYTIEGLPVGDYALTASGPEGWRRWETADEEYVTVAREGETVWVETVKLARAR